MRNGRLYHTIKLCVFCTAIIWRCTAYKYSWNAIFKNDLTSLQHYQTKNQIVWSWEPPRYNWNFVESGVKYHTPLIVWANVLIVKLYRFLATVKYESFVNGTNRIWVYMNMQHMNRKSHTMMFDKPNLFIECLAVYNNIWNHLLYIHER